MNRGMVLFKNFIRRTFCGRPGLATGRASHAVAAWLAASALTGSTSTALSVSPRDSYPDVRTERAAQASPLPAQNGRGPSPQNQAPGQWTWASGSSEIAEQVRYGVYGTKGVSDPANSPGMRDSSVSWTDASGNFWLFGGNGYGAIAEGRLNDLWKRDVATGRWTWTSGSNAPNEPGTYGTRGVASPENVPGGREGAISWTDTNGIFWLFGGLGYPLPRSSSALNDLWKFDPASGLWTWVSGSSTMNQLGTYGARGVAAPGNVPGARQNSVSWADNGGNLWLFGGGRNDLWKFNIASGLWTWVSGSDGTNNASSYGTKGVAAPGNVPGVRYGSSAWADSKGNLWLFGGQGWDGNAHVGVMNDLWKFDIASGLWTWVSGSDEVRQAGKYGTQGVADPGNVPGARNYSVCWTDSGGNLWLFGGSFYPGNGLAYLNDLWKFNMASGLWTWVSGSNQVDQVGSYGTQGVETPGTVPGARYGAVSWKDSAGNLWLFGGRVFRANLVYQYSLNDLWKWNTSTGLWTWVSGSNAVYKVGNYGTKEVAAPENVPGPRYGAASWTDTSGNFWLFGGTPSASEGGMLNDLWKWSTSTALWTWVSGSNEMNQLGTYGTKGVAAPENVPGAREDPVSWTDANGNLWLFGGLAYMVVPSFGLMSDLWKFDVSIGQWTWVSGSESRDQNGTYGAQGVEAPGNAPGARYRSASWTDTAGYLWLFGGRGTSGDQNDLWKFNLSSGLWTWVSGSNWSGQGGTYGTQGVAAPGNVPGARSGAVSWIDGSGSLWLFGGGSNSSGASGGGKNDLWKFSISTGLWTWVSGSNVSNQPGTYGTLGVAAPQNAPGARSYPVFWTDIGGNFWLFGGSGYAANESGMFNDLWKRDVSSGQWTWVSGSSGVSQIGTYGTPGVAASGNMPGARELSASWADTYGNLWLFGGYGSGAIRSYGSLNDLWVYTPPTEFSASSPLYLVPGVAWTAGQGGAEWQSDLSIFNPSSTSPVTLQLALLEASRPISSLTDLDGKWKTTSISPHATVSFINVVSTLFRLAKGSYGAVLVREEVDASAQPVLSGKTYDVSRGAAGTVGLSLPAAKLPSGAGVGIQATSDPADLIGLRDDGAHYTNLSIANLYNDYVTAEVTFWGADGTQLGQPVTMQLNPFGVQQLTNVLSAAPPAGAGYDKAAHPVASYRARVRIVSGTAILPYASVVDDVSKDPILVTGANAPESSYRIPGIVRTAGKANTLWRSDLVVHNPSAQARSVRAVYSWVDGSGTGHNSAESIPLAPGQILQWTDFVKLWLSLPDADTTSFINSFVDVSPADTNADPLLVTARVYNTQPSGNVGLGVPGFTSSDSASSAGSNTRLVFPGLTSDANFRSNLALFLTSSSSGSSASANINIYDAGGTLLKSAPIWLGVPNRFAQVSIDDLIASATGDKSNLSIVVDSLTGSPISGYATIVDNRSGDGSLVPGTPLP